MTTTRRDLMVTGVFLVGGVATLLFALSEATTWALGLLGLLLAAVGAVSRLEFATRRRDFQFQRSEVRALQTAVRGLQKTVQLAHDAHRRSTSDLHTESLGRFQDVQKQLNRGFRSARHDAQLISDMKADLSMDMMALRSEIRGLRVSQQLISQTTASTKAELRSSLAASSAVIDDLQSLHQLFGRYMPTAPLPPLADSHLRASGSYFAADLIERRRPSRVLHRGALASALWIGHALRRSGRGVLVVDARTYEEASLAAESLADNGLTDWVDVRATAAPLDSASTADHPANFPAYDGPRVDVLVLDQLIVDPLSEAGLATASEIDLMLADNAIVIVACADDPRVHGVLRAWSDANPGITRLLSPRADIAVLSWGPVMRSEN